MRIAELELTALTGATVDGGWPQDLEAEENLHTLVRVTSEDGLVGMNVISYRPDEKQDGYFLLLASPEVKVQRARPLAKNVVFVVDRSGSMNGKKIEQAREALKYLVGRLGPRDTFNIVAYDTQVESFRPELQRVNEKTQKAALGFADGLFAGGSTNIDGALIKTGFAICEIIFPHALEAQIKALLGNTVPGVLEAALPFGQRAGIGFAKEFRMTQFKASVADRC